jgi:hypothetical protein
MKMMESEMKTKVGKRRMDPIVLKWGRTSPRVRGIERVVKLRFKYFVFLTCCFDTRNFVRNWAIMISGF